MLRAIAKTVLLFASLFPAKAMSQDEVEAFYKGKVITITSAGGVGGGYGLYAMMLSENLSKHLPGHPKINGNYNPNASGLAAADYMYNVAPKDGTAILAPLSSMTTLQVLGAPGVRFDASKFHWIGRAAETKSLFLAKVGAARDGSTVQTVVRGEDGSRFNRSTLKTKSLRLAVSAIFRTKAPPGSPKEPV